MSITGRRGEIIGVSGVVGNGQSELLRALAGLASFEGDVLVGGHERSQRQLLQGLAATCRRTVTTTA